MTKGHGRRYLPAELFVPGKCLVCGKPDVRGIRCKPCQEEFEHMQWLMKRRSDDF